MSGRRRIQSVDRAVALLSALAASRSELALTDLAQRCGLNRSTAWRLLSTLEFHGLVERDELSQRYGLGYRVLQFASVARSGYGFLVRTARPLLERLADETGETANLSIPAQSSVICIDQVDAAPMLAVNWVDRPLPLYCSSNGKLELAYLPEQELSAYISETVLEPVAPQTITDPALLRADVARTAERGYGITVCELEAGVNGVSAPIVLDGGRPIGYLSVSGPSFRLSEEMLHEVSARLVEAAGVVAARLAGEPTDAVAATDRGGRE